MKGLIFISANGIGHAQRVQPLVSLLINNGVTLYIFTGKKQCEFLKSKSINSSNLVILRSNYIESVPSYNMVATDRYISVNDLHQEFETDLRCLGEIEFDFLISDNYAAPLKWMVAKRKILIANFFWGDIWDKSSFFQRLSECEIWTQLESVDHNKDFIVASEIEFSTVKGLTDIFFKYIDVASYSPKIDQILTSQKIQVLISLGRTGERSFLFDVVLDLFDKASNHSGIFEFYSLGPVLERFSQAVTFIDESYDFSKMDIVITRGGLGSLKDAVANDLFSFFIETDDFELAKNQARARELGIGTNLVDLETALCSVSANDVLFKICAIVNRTFEGRRDPVPSRVLEDLIMDLIVN